MKEIGRYFKQSDANTKETNGSGHGQQVSSGRDVCNSGIPSPQAMSGCHVDQELNVIPSPCDGKMITNVNSRRLCLGQEYST